MLQLLQLLAPYVVWLYPIGVLVLLIYLRNWLMASRDLRASLFSLEREVAVRRMRRAATGAFCTFGVLVACFCTQFFLASALDLDRIIHPTPTPGFTVPTVARVETPTPDPRTPSPTPSPTPTRQPTVARTTPAPTPAVETPPPPAPPANCPTEGVQITWPGQGAHVSGRLEIRGTANIPGFNFYKIELGLGEEPGGWSGIGDMHYEPVSNGVLDVLDTSSLPAGTYSIRLVVVDLTGNYPPPCTVQIVVTH